MNRAVRVVEYLASSSTSTAMTPLCGEQMMQRWVCSSPLEGPVPAPVSVP
jgi:hypothetical protein